MTGLAAALGLIAIVFAAVALFAVIKLWRGRADADNRAAQAILLSDQSIGAEYREQAEKISRLGSAGERLAAALELSRKRAAERAAKPGCDGKP